MAKEVSAAPRYLREGRWPLPTLQARLRPAWGAANPFIFNRNYLKFLRFQLLVRNKM
jgi:hypothetical protein